SILCRDELLCSAHDNFATPDRAGVDNVVYFGNATGEAADFKAQVARWLQWEEKHPRRERGDTMFTVWFGVSDVLKFSLMKRREAIMAVEASLDTLFETLVRFPPR